MEFKHIEYFLEACRHKSLSQAAESLFISQQALSRCIQNLERELGCKLFTRTVTGTVLTEEGAYLKAQFEPIVEAFYEKQTEAESHFSGRPRPVVLASAPHLFSVLDTEILFDYKQKHPGIDLEVEEMPDREVAQYVQEDVRHLGLIAEPEHRLKGMFEYTVVQSYPLCVCLHKDHPLAGRVSVDFGELRNERFLALDKRSHYQSMMEEAAKKYGFTPNIVFETADVNQICNLVNSGKGISVATRSPAFGTIFPNIVAVPVNDQELTYHIAFIYQAWSKLEPAYRKLIEFVKTASHVQA